MNQTKALVSLALALAFAVAGCASHPEEDDRPLAAAPAPAPDPNAPKKPRPPINWKSLAANASTASECESMARIYRDQSADDGWAMLNACVDRGHFGRTDFTNMRRLLDGTWDAALTGRVDAPKLLTKLMALRGGDVEGDINNLQRRRIPLFTLSAAMAQPELFKGRLLVVRAVLQELRVDAGIQVATLSERTLHGESVNSFKRGATLEMSQRGYAGPQSGTVSYRYSTENMVNLAQPTGMIGIGRLAAPDPFLATGQQFLFLARFDGVRTEANNIDDGVGHDEVKKFALLTVLSYVEPEASVVE